MKKSYIFALGTLFLIFSCKQNSNGNKGIIPENSKNLNIEKPKFIVDSVKVDDSITISKTLKLHSSSKVLVFSDIKNKTVLDSIYSNSGINLNDYSKENLLKEITKQKENYFAQGKKDSKEYMPDFEQTWEENSSMDLVSNQNEILTISYSTDGYSGGAHGYYGITYKNFDLKENKVVQLSDLFSDVNKINWNKILLENFNKIDFGEGYSKDKSDLLFEQKIPVTDNFYFNQDKITFIYNQYEIAPYAVGVVEIPVPFSELKPYLKLDFVKRMNIK